MKQLVIGMVVLLACRAAVSQEFAAAQINGIHRHTSPAVGLLRYSSEIVNNNTGEVTKRDGTALGLVVSPTGLVMTHGHMVLEGSTPFNISLTLGLPESPKEYGAKLLKKPKDLNVVFLQLESPQPLNLPCVKFKSAPEFSIGQPFVLVGMLGESLDFAPGIEQVRVNAILDHPRRTYCLDGNIRFGFVGAPVYGPSGEAVGVVGYDMSRAEGADIYTRSGHPLLYQTALFQAYIDSPPGEKADEEEEDSNAWLGVFTQPLTDGFAKYWHLDPKGGLIVSTVVPGSPAAEVGLRPGDVITRFNNKAIQARQDRDVLSFTAMVREAGAGNEVPLSILREGQPQELKVKVGQRPRTSQDAAEFEDAVLGVTVRELTTDARIGMNLPEGLSGVVVRRVRSGSAAQEAGLRSMVIIMRIGDKAIQSLDDYRAAVAELASGKPPEVSIFGRYGSGETGFFRLAPRW